MSEYIVKCNEVVGISGKTLIVPDYIDTSEEIVRCRDCKYHEPVPEDSGDWCGYWTDRVYGTDGFCKWGKPRGEGEGE